MKTQYEQYRDFAWSLTPADEQQARVSMLIYVLDDVPRKAFDDAMDWLRDQYKPKPEVAEVQS